MDISCMLVIDSTTSMGWIHRYLRNHLARTVSDFKVEGRTIDFGVMGFRDTKCRKYPWIEYNSFGNLGEDDGPPLSRNRWLFEGERRRGPERADGLSETQTTLFGSHGPHRPSTERLAVWHPRPSEDTLRQLRAKGGGNNSAESSLFAVRSSLGLRWPESRRRIIAIFTDERPHIPDRLVESWDSINKDLVEAEINQVHLFVTPNRQTDYEGLTFSGVQILFHDLTRDLTSLDKSFRDFVQTSSEWDDDDDEDIVPDDWDDEVNPFDD